MDVQTRYVTNKASITKLLFPLHLFLFLHVILRDIIAVRIRIVIYEIRFRNWNRLRIGVFFVIKVFKSRELSGDDVVSAVCEWICLFFTFRFCNLR